jgi:hypothetical protein
MPKDYVVVLQAEAAARLMPEVAVQVPMNGLPGAVGGQTTFRVRTKWEDIGLEHPTPRHLWIEARLTANSIDDAIRLASAASQPLALAAAFVANAATGVPEVHLAFDATDGAAEREFLEVFIADRIGLPGEGSALDPEEFVLFLDRYLPSENAATIGRALQQYNLALRSYRIGSEWLALAHLFIAVENLKEARLDLECARQKLNREDLARSWHDPNINFNKKGWPERIIARSRLHLVFRGDVDAYKAAADASNGLEHGSMSLDEVQRHALQSADSTFQYVRESILELLSIDPDSHRPLWERPPRDVASLRRIVRGAFLGEGPLTEESQEYPALLWTSRIAGIAREGTKVTFSTEDKLKVLAAAGINFRADRLELLGRIVKGAPTVELQDPIPVEVAVSGEDVVTRVRRLSEAANQLANAAAAPGLELGIPPLRRPAFMYLCQQTAYFEAAIALLLQRRGLEVYSVLIDMVEVLRHLQSYVDPEQGAGFMVRDAIDTELALVELARAQGLTRVDQVEAWLAAADKDGINVPDAWSSGVSVIDEGLASFEAFARSITSRALVLAELHMETSSSAEVQGFKTAQLDDRLIEEQLNNAIELLLRSAKAATTALDWPFDVEAADALSTEAAPRVRDESPASTNMHGD